jgi:hypothetical protein
MNRSGCVPTKHHDSEELPCRKLDEEIRYHGLPDQLCDVDNGTEPAVLIADEIGVFDETEYSGIA